ncbi:MAG: hypothetical protein ABT940_11710 [Alphaproteobacteria bacterium]
MLPVGLERGTAEVLGPIKFLVVDGDDKRRQELCGMLRSMSARDVAEAGDGAGALAGIESSSPDVVFVRWTLADTDAVIFAQQVRRARRSQRGRFAAIVVVGTAAPARMEAALGVGVNEFLAAPKSRHTLAETLSLLVHGVRPFVIANTYVGPCRRRQEVAPPSGRNRRVTAATLAEPPYAATFASIAKKMPAPPRHASPPPVPVTAPVPSLEDRVRPPAAVAEFRPAPSKPPAEKPVRRPGGSAAASPVTPLPIRVRPSPPPVQSAPVAPDRGGMTQQDVLAALTRNGSAPEARLAAGGSTGGDARERELLEAFQAWAGRGTGSRSPVRVASGRRR